MRRFYSQTTLVTYLEGLHRVMPADAQEITEERYLQVLGNPEPGKVRGHDADGLPILIDPPLEDLAIAARAWRDAQIGRVQWVRDRHRDELDLGRATTITDDQFAGLLAYMQLLRDWPLHIDFPADGSRPSPPNWIANQIE